MPNGPKFLTINPRGDLEASPPAVCDLEVPAQAYKGLDMAETQTADDLTSVVDINPTMTHTMTFDLDL